MRLFALIALLCLGMALFVFSGCDSDDGVGFDVTGTATNAFTGTLTPGVSLALLTDGFPIRTDTTDAGGEFIFLNVPNGTYTIRATNIDGGPAVTLFGPFTVAGGDVSGIDVDVASLAQFGFVNPINNSATLLAFGTDAAGNPVSVTAAVDGQLTDLPGNPAVLPNIPLGTFDVVVANPATGQNVFFENVPFQTNTIVVVRAEFSIQTTAVSFGATVLDFPTGTFLPGASVQLLQNGNPVGAPVTTGEGGEFTLSNVNPAADYTLRIASPTDGFLTTYFWPVSILESSSGFVFTVATAQALEVTPPTDGTAALLAYGLDANDDEVPVTVTLDFGPPTLADSPVLLGNITPGTHTVTVTGTDLGAESVIFPNVAFQANTVTVFRAAVE